MNGQAGRMAAILLATAIAASPIGAQQAEPTPDQGDRVRTWQIYLKSGDVIEFDGQFNWDGANKGPAQFLAEYQAYVTGQAIPPILRYAFPSPDSERAADIVIDLREIAAIVQKF